MSFTSINFFKPILSIEKSGKTKHFFAAAGIAASCIAALLYLFLQEFSHYLVANADKNSMQLEFDAQKHIMHKKNMLEKQLTEIQQTYKTLNFQANRRFPLLKCISDTIPKDIYISKYYVHGNVAELVGYAETLSTLHAFIASLQKNDFIESIHVTKTTQEKVDEQNLIKFFSTLTLKN